MSQISHLRVLAALLGCAASSCFLDPDVKTTRTEAAAPQPNSAPVAFARDIRPILAGSNGSGGCRPCHYAADPGAEGVAIARLDFTTLGTLRRGGVSGAARLIVAGKPDESLLIQRIEGSVGPQMPKNRAPLSAAEIAKVREWIAQGAEGGDAE
jgi:hypothetical protein